MGGHSDVVGGALIVSDLALGEELAYHQNAMGAVAGPFDSWLVLRGTKTSRCAWTGTARTPRRPPTC